MQQEKNIFEYGISPYLCKTLKLNETSNYTLLKIKSNCICLYNRLDILAKYYFAFCKIHNIMSTYAYDLYKEHIRAFSSGTFKEPGQPNKNSIQQYIDVFENMLNSFNNNEFESFESYIPFSKDLIPLDGAHRITCHILFNKEINVIKLQDILGYKSDYEYFKKQFLKIEYLENLVEMCVHMQDNLYVVCLWPKAFETKKIEMAKQLISKTHSIIAEKQVYLSYVGMRNLMVQIYGHQDWVGNEKNNYSGVNGKVDKCYVQKMPVTVLIIEDQSLESIIHLKKTIRDFFQLENHSIHITDTRQEAIQMVELLFNKNSIDFMNNADLAKFKRYKNMSASFVEKKKLYNNETPIMDPSCTLDLYNITGKVGTFCKDIYSDEVLYDINNFFNFANKKFFTLKCIANFMNESDKEYIKTILTTTDKCSYLQIFLLYVKRQCYYCTFRIFRGSIKIIQYLHLYNFIRLLYRKINGVKQNDK